MRSLLQAPPGLRQHILHYIQRLSPIRFHAIGSRRAFSNGFRLTKQSQINPRSNTASPIRPFPKTNNTKPSINYIETILGGNDKVLLYLSPSHGTLYASSYLIGGAFLFGAYSWAQFALKEAPSKDGQPAEQRRPWFIKLALSAEVLVVVVLGTHFLLTPGKLIKTIAIVKNAASSSTVSQAEPFLRLEVKRALPFLKPDVLEIAPSAIFREPRLVSAEPTVRRFTLPLADAPTFTSKYFSGAKMVSPLPRPSFVRSLWPAVKRDTRRMFMRDQMAYLRTATNGRFKLDMQGAVFLEGDALFHLIPQDQEQRLGLMGYIRGFLSA